MTTLAGYERALRELTKVPSRAAKSAAPKIRRLITEEFNRGEDPYGNAWAPLKPATLARGRRPPPLTDTRRLRRGIRVFPMAKAGIQITVDAPYAGFHQSGTSRMGARPILPKRGLPKKWRAAIERSVKEAYGGK
jgi:phage gpG-like protein